MATVHNTEYVTIAQAFEANYKVHSESNKEQFLAVWEVAKRFEKKERVAQLGLMKKASEKIELNSARREYKALLTMAEEYASLPPMMVNLVAITFDNLSRVLRLVKRMNKHYEGDMNKLQPIAIYEAGMSDFRYNNLLTEKCQRVSEKYPTITKAHVVTVEEALVYADTLNVTAKRALLERLMADLGIEVEEEEEVLEVA